MKWLARLKKLTNAPDDSLTKLPKGVSVSFVSDPEAHIEAFSAAPEPITITCGQCRHFIRDRVNPLAGWGACAMGQTYPRDAPPKPFRQRECSAYRLGDSLDVQRAAQRLDCPLDAGLGIICLGRECGGGKRTFGGAIDLANGATASRSARTGGSGWEGST